MRRQLIRWFAALVSRLGGTGLFLWLTDSCRLRYRPGHRLPIPYIVRARRNRRFLILAYHRVNDERDYYFPATPVSRFARQVELLDRHFNVLPLEELVTRAKEGDLPRNAIAITFDDGYRDNYSNAFPILARYGLPATIFLTTGAVDSGANLWHDLVLTAFRDSKAQSLPFNGEDLPLSTVAQRSATLSVVLRDLRRSSPDERDEKIEQLLGKLGLSADTCGVAAKLSWSEIEAMSRSNISFGSHTVSHPTLSRIALDLARKEIHDSKRAIEKHLGIPVTLFAYPNGGRDDYDHSIQEILSSEGFLCAVTSISGSNGIETHPYELRRTGMFGDDPTASILRLGWYRATS